MNWLWFVFGTALCWGAYVPTLHAGQLALGPKSSLRAFLCVGLAYFATAVLVPFVAVRAGAEPWQFNARGLSISVLAGVLGAAGALGIIYAVRTGGKPIYVAPLVFGLAPVVNVLITMFMHRPEKPIPMQFYLGLLLAAVGAGLVLRYKPE